MTGTWVKRAGLRSVEDAWASQREAWERLGAAEGASAETRGVRAGDSGPQAQPRCESRGPPDPLR